MRLLCHQRNREQGQDVTFMPSAYFVGCELYVQTEMDKYRFFESKLFSDQNKHVKNCVDNFNVLLIFFFVVRNAVNFWWKGRDLRKTQ